MAKHGYRRSEVAKAARVSRQAVALWFAGEGDFRSVHVANLLNLSAGLGIAPAELLQPLPGLTDSVGEKGCTQSRLYAEFCWDRSYPDIYRFLVALAEAQPRAVARYIESRILVGGTALAGFYAGHRSSDDLDLFTGNPHAFTQTVPAVRSLRTIEVELEERNRSNQYCRAVCYHDELAFTVDVVLDEHVVGMTETNTAGGVVVVDVAVIVELLGEPLTGTTQVAEVGEVHASLTGEPRDLTRDVDGLSASGCAPGTRSACCAARSHRPRIICHLVTRHELYDDRILFGQQHQERKRHERRLRNQARALGFNLVPETT